VSDPAGNATRPEQSSATKTQLDRAAFYGVAWMGAAKWSTQLLSWIGTILVARILSPEDYGIIALASVYLGLLNIVSEFGIGATILVKRDLKGKLLAQLNSTAALIGMACFLCSVVLAVPLGMFFRSQELPLVVVAMSATFIINALVTVPAATLRRELRFRVLAMIDVARGSLVPIGTLALAFLGFRYWALVGGAVLSAAISASITLAVRRHAFGWPSWTALHSSLQFSAQVLVSRIAWFVYSNGDYVVAGRRLGEAPLGEYSLAMTLATTPTAKVHALLMDVAPSLFAAVQDRRDELRRYFLNVTELLAFVCIPTCIGLSLVSGDLVVVLLGEKWRAVTVPLMLLAAYSTVRTLTPLFGHVFIAVGLSRFSMWLAICMAILMPIGFYVGSFWGTIGIAASWLLFHPLMMLLAYFRIAAILAMPTRQYLQALRLGLDGTIVMASAVLVVRHLLELHHPLNRLLVEVPTGAFVFAFTTLALHGQRLREIIQWFRRIRAAA